MYIGCGQCSAPVLFACCALNPNPNPTPNLQEVAIIDVRKEISFCRKVGLRVLGVVENMSGLQQRTPELRFSYSPKAVGENCAPLDVTQHVMELLKTQFQDLSQLVMHTNVFHASGGGAAKMCVDMGVPLLGAVPLDAALSRAAEEGRSVFEPLQLERDGKVVGTHPAAVCLPSMKAIVFMLKYSILLS
jgi:hypothetical protein